MKITKKMCEDAYPIMKRVWESALSKNDAKHEINKSTGMSKGSAQIYITIFFSMMGGKGYKRAFNNDGNRLLFQKIREDYGDEYYMKALDAAEKHVTYYSTLEKRNLSGLSAIIKECRALI